VGKDLAEEEEEAVVLSAIALTGMRQGCAPH